MRSSRRDTPWVLTAFSFLFNARFFAEADLVVNSGRQAFFAK